MKNTNNFSVFGKRAHSISGEGPLVITRVTLKAGKPTSYDLKTSTGRPFGQGAMFQGTPVHIFNATANKCALEQGEHLVIELYRDSDAVGVEVEIEEGN
jgi:hypothetical protein